MWYNDFRGRMNFIKTHCQTIDDLLLGGFQKSRISGIVGAEDVGKSQIAAQILVSNQPSMVIETEGKGYDLIFDYMLKRFNVKNDVKLEYVIGFDELMKFFGLDVKIIISDKGKTKPIIEFLDWEETELNKILKKSKFNVVILDSLSAPMKHRLDSNTENFSTRATIEQALFGRMLLYAFKYDFAFIVIHHIQGLDAMKPWKEREAYGGSPIVYNASNLLFIYEPTKENIKDVGKDTIKRVKRGRLIGKRESELMLVDLQEDYGYIDVKPIETKNGELSEE